MRRMIIFSLACLISFGIRLTYADSMSGYVKDVENMISKQKEVYKAMTEQNYSVAQSVAKEINSTGKILTKEMISAGIKKTLGPAGSLLTVAKGITIAAEGLAVVAESKLNIMKENFVIPYVEAREKGFDDEAAWNAAKRESMLEVLFEGVKPKYREAKVREYAKEAYELKVKIQQDEEQLVSIKTYTAAKEDILDKSAIFSQEMVKNSSNNQASKYANLAYQIPYGKISPPELAKKINDSSQLSERTSQQLLTPVNVRFTQTFDGLFTQSADSLNSLGGNHSGTLTAGTRIGAGSRPGDFTSGSFSGRTIAESGYTPATWTNVAFSGTSVGMATARGFQEGGDLKGSMTVTVPAGTQTAAVSGSITISTDGSLSMPSYSGPVTVDATGQKVGTMSGSWSQGPTQ